MVGTMRPVIPLLLWTFIPLVSIAPELSKTCTAVGHRLLVETRMGVLTDQQASVAFENCQRRFPPLSPDQPENL